MAYKCILLFKKSLRLIYEQYTFMSVGQWLIEIICKSGIIRKTDVHTFANGPRTSNAPYDTVNNGLYVSAETPQPRWFVSVKQAKDHSHFYVHPNTLRNYLQLLRKYS